MIKPVDRLQGLALNLRKEAETNPDEADKCVALADVFEAAAEDIAERHAGNLTLAVLTYARLAPDDMVHTYRDRGEETP